MPLGRLAQPLTPGDLGAYLGAPCFPVTLPPPLSEMAISNLDVPLSLPFTSPPLLGSQTEETTHLLSYREQKSQQRRACRSFPPTPLKTSSSLRLAPHMSHALPTAGCFLGLPWPLYVL